MKPNANEHKHAMEFLIDTAMAPSVSEASRRKGFGPAMNLICETWIVSLSLDEQQRSRTDLVITTSLISSLHIGTVQSMARGDKRDVRHPWSSWDVTRRLTGVAAYTVGGFSHVEVDPKEATKSCTDSLDEMA